MRKFLGSRSAECLPCQVLFENSNGNQVILTLFLGFGCSLLLDSKITERIKNELALVNQIGSDVIFALQQNIVLNFLCNPERSETS